MNTPQHPMSAISALNTGVVPDFSILSLPDNYLASRDEAVQLSRAMGCPVAKSTLAKILCVSSDGPPVQFFGRKPRYQVGSFKNWIKSRLSAPVRSSSERAA